MYLTKIDKTGVIFIQWDDVVQCISTGPSVCLSYVANIWKSSQFLLKSGVEGLSVTSVQAVYVYLYRHIHHMSDLRAHYE